MSISKLLLIIFLITIGMYLLGFFPVVTGIIAGIAALIAAVAMAVDK